MVETDVVNEPRVTAVDDDDDCSGDSVTTTKICGRDCHRPQLRGLSASWRVGFAACEKSDGVGPVRNDRSNRTLLVGDSGGTFPAKY